MTQQVRGGALRRLLGQHWLLLAVFAVGVVALPTWGRAHRGTAVELAFRRAFAVVLGAAFVGMQVYYQLEPGPFHLGSALPLELCDLAEVAAVVALLTRNEVATAFTYYVGPDPVGAGHPDPGADPAVPDDQVPRLLGPAPAGGLGGGVPHLGPRLPPDLAALRDRLLAHDRAGRWRRTASTWRSAPTTATSTASRPRRRCWTCWGRGPGTSSRRSPIVAAGWALVLTLPWELLRARSRRR